MRLMSGASAKNRAADERPESRLSSTRFANGRAHTRQPLRQLTSPTRMASPYVEIRGYCTAAGRFNARHICKILNTSFQA